MASIRTDLEWTSKTLSATAFFLAGIVAGTGLYFANLYHVKADTEAAARAAAAARNVQAGYLTNRIVGNGAHIKGCVPSAQPAPGAAAAVGCTPIQQGIKLSAVSFPLTDTDQATGFVPEAIGGESLGLNAFLRSILPVSMAVVPTQATASVFGQGSSADCANLGFAGYHNVSDDVVSGRIYCYKRSGTYYLVWTYDNDEYEIQHNEDLAVVASSRKLSTLINWYDSSPV